MYKNINYYTFTNAMDIITRDKFFVKIPRLYIYTDEERSLFGMPLDEVNGKVNKKSALDLVDSYKNIYELSIIASENATILIKNDDDIIKILDSANEAIEILNNSPLTPDLIERKEDIVYNLTTLVNKIKELNKDYINYLYRKNDPVDNYLNNTFGVFNILKTNKEPNIKIVNKNNNEVEDNNRMYGIDFNSISVPD